MWLFLIIILLQLRKKRYQQNKKLQSLLTEADFYYAKKNDLVNHFLKAVKPPAMRVRTEKFITMYDNKKLHVIIIVSARRKLL